jgi:hypothetical protein
VLPLIVQRLLRDVAALCDSVADVLSRCWYVVRKLHRDACDEFACMANVAAASREEEASCQTLLIEVPTCDCLRDCRLACACKAAEPEDASLIRSIRPTVYLVQKAFARVAEAGAFVLFCVRIKGRVSSLRQPCKYVLSVSKLVSD